MARLLALLVVLAVGVPACAQPVNLGEKAAAGDCARYLIEMDLKGNLIVAQEGQRQSIRLEAKARHAFAERTMAVADGMATTSVRHYSEAVATALVAGEKSIRKLADDRRLIIARRKADGLFCYSPAGPLSRDDLDLVTEHFNPQCLPGLLPGKVVNVGDSWNVSDNSAQAACLFEGILKNSLTGKLTSMKDGIATFSIEGTAEGIEHGAKVALTITATGTFDAASARVTGLSWKQKDVRDQGAVNPASEIDVQVVLKCVPLNDEPKELADETIGKLPDASAKTAQLRLTDTKGRYHFTHAREWYITGQTESHLVMRLIEKDELVAQATITVWQKLEPGKHSPGAEFKKAVGDTPGWIAGKTLAEGEMPIDGGRWLYRIAIEGKIDSRPAVQTFFLLAGPQGDQVAITVVMKPEAMKAGVSRVEELVKAIELAKK